MKIINLLVLPNIFFQSTEETFVKQIIAEKKFVTPIYGQFSIFAEEDDAYYLIRDRLGINKLFYSVDVNNKTLVFGSYFYDVVSTTKDYNNVFSVPPGHAIKFNKHSLEKRELKYCDISETADCGDFKLDQFQGKIDKKLSSFFNEINSTYPNSLFVICLSGGLDSTVLATYAAKHLKRLVAATFSYNDFMSDDFQAASSIAEALNIKFLPILGNRKIEMPTLDSILRYCQDWRDFNVHCAWVNYHIGEKVRSVYPSENLIFITGDLMNEYVADYEPVNYRGTTYYDQPKVSKGRLRKFFTFGLDTSDREVGIFHKFNIKTFQPYSILAEDYLSLPDDLFEKSKPKEMLNLGMIQNEEIKSLVTKSKVRAQVGGKDGGTLGLFHDNGVTQEILKKRWENLFQPLAQGQKFDSLFFSGRYRTG